MNTSNSSYPFAGFTISYRQQAKDNYLRHMNHFTIRDVENLSGIKAHTWRIWEQRYNLCLPQRKESNHRFYDAENLKQILRIAYLYHRGMKISKIAACGDSEIISLSKQKGEAEVASPFFVKEMMEAALNNHPDVFNKVCEEVFAKYDTEDAVLKIVYPYLERVGVLWLTDHIVPAQEHFTSNIIRNKIIRATNNLKPDYRTDYPVTLLFTPEKEHHELPLLFIHYLLKAAGKPVYYFGANIKTSDVIQFVHEKRVTRIHFHLITNLTNTDAQRYVSSLAKALPESNIMMSGPMAAQVQELPANARLLMSMDELVACAKE